MGWIFWRKKKKIKPSCATCKFRKEHQVYGNNDQVITLGTCLNNKAVAFSPSPNGFYYPNGSIVTYPPDFACANYKDATDKTGNTAV